MRDWLPTGTPADLWQEELVDLALSLRGERQPFSQGEGQRAVGVGWGVGVVMTGAGGAPQVLLHVTTVSSTARIPAQRPCLHRYA